MSKLIEDVIVKNRIKKLRTEYLDMTQEEFAKNIEGCSRSYISHLESGKKMPTERTIKDICRAYGISFNWLAYGKGEEIEDSIKIKKQKTEIKNLINMFETLDEKEQEAILNMMKIMATK